MAEKYISSTDPALCWTLTSWLCSHWHRKLNRMFVMDGGAAAGAKPELESRCAAWHVIQHCGSRAVWKKSRVQIYHRPPQVRPKMHSGDTKSLMIASHPQTPPSMRMNKEKETIVYFTTLQEHVSLLFFKIVSEVFSLLNFDTASWNLALYQFK